MRIIWLALLGGMFLLGCQRTKLGHATPEAIPKTKTQPTPARAGGMPPAPATAPANPPPRVMPALDVVGRVRSLHPTLGFVVIECMVSPLPPAGARMSVYRQGLKVGEVKINAERSSINVAADVVAGTAKPGDEVRSN